MTDPMPAGLALTLFFLFVFLVALAFYTVWKYRPGSGKNGKTYRSPTEGGEKN